MPFPISTANKQVNCAKVLVFTENHKALRGQWMKRVGDSDFAGQSSGIMNCLPILAVSGLLSSIV